MKNFFMNSNRSIERTFSFYLLKNKINLLNRDRLFILGLIIKIFLIFFISPPLISNLFLPFIKNSIENISFDPWSTHLLYQGDFNSFPYGIIMLFIFLPLSIFGNFIDNNFLNLNFLEFGFKVTLLLFDYLLLLSLYFVTKEKSRKLLLIIFWLSPITIYCNYIYGAIDIIPISILIFSIHLIKLNKYIYSGFFFGIAVTSKFSMLIALPFIFIYILKRRGLDKELNFFLFSFILISVMLNIPFLNSYGFKEMVLGTNSIDSLYSVYLSYGNNLKLYIVPVIYIFSLYLVWRLKRITIDLFFISIGIGFFSILVFLPPAPGWILWVIPFLIYYQITSKKDIFLICIVYNIIYIINVFNLSKIMNEDDFFSHLLMLKENSFSLKDSLLFTLQQSLGLLLAVRMYIYGLVRNNFYSLSNNALLISLSGNEK